MVAWGAAATGYVGMADSINLHTGAVYQGQAGTGAGDYDYTQTLIAPNGSSYQVLPYTTLDLAPFGVPTDATYASFGVKAIVTKSSTTSGLADVFAFMRVPGSLCCQGLPQAPQFPIDGGFGQRVEGMVQQAVAQLAGDGQRSWSVVTVPIADGKVEFSWGYQKVPGAWPAGDAVAIDVYLNGYYRS